MNIDLKSLWAAIIAAVVEQLRKWLDPIDPSLAPRMGAALTAAAEDGGTLDVNLPEKVGAAPDELKELVRAMLTKLVTERLKGRPLVAKLLLALIENLPDALLDQLWDSLFKSGAVHSPAPMRGTVSAQANPIAAAFAADLT